MRLNPTVWKQGCFEQQSSYFIPKPMQSTIMYSTFNTLILFHFCFFLLWGYFMNFEQLVNDYKNPASNNFVIYYCCIYELKTYFMSIVISSLFTYKILRWLWFIPFHNFSSSFFSGHLENNNGKFQPKMYSMYDDLLFSETHIDWMC